MNAIISRLLAIFFTVFSFFTVAQPQNVEITVKEITTESTSVVFTCKNNTGKIMSEIDYINLEQNVEGEWHKIRVDYYIPEMAYRIYPSETVTKSFRLSFTEFGEPGEVTATCFNLEKGEYRMTVGYRVYEFFKGWTDAKATTIFVVEK